MLIYIFIPNILYSFLKINIITTFICFSLYVREMFRLKQISSHFSVADVCFLGRRRFFCACQWYHYSAIINHISAPAPRPSPTPPSPQQQWALKEGWRGAPGMYARTRGPMTAREQFYDVLSVSQQQRNVHSLHINPTLFSMLKNKNKNIFL